MEIIENLVTIINEYLWNSILLLLLCGAGIYFTFLLKFVQIRKFKEGILSAFPISESKKSSSEISDSGNSSFRSLAMAVGSCVGTGNIAGAASAIVSGGPGAIFWMWVSAFFGMATVFAESTLAQKYRVEINGEIFGGPVYYIRESFKGFFGKMLASFFALFIIMALGLFGNMVQSNSISTSFARAFGIDPLLIGLITSILVGFVVVGGVKRIGDISEQLVPTMAILYITGSCIIIGMNYDNILPAIKSIFIAAFHPQAITGGIVGITIRESLRYGVARGLFSNEAGMGSIPHAHALAKVNHPCQQGIVAMIGVFIDTFVILTITAMVILTSYHSFADIIGTNTTGVELAQQAFSMNIGSMGNIFIAIFMFFFAFSSIIGWYYFGEINVRYLFGKKAVGIYTILVLVFVLLGAILKVELVWGMADMFNGFMVIPNLIGLVALGNVVKELSNEYDRKK